MILQQKGVSAIQTGLQKDSWYTSTQVHTTNMQCATTEPWTICLAMTTAQNVTPHVVPVAKQVISGWSAAEAILSPKRPSNEDKVSRGEKWSWRGQLHGGQKNTYTIHTGKKYGAVCDGIFFQDMTIHNQPQHFSEDTDLSDDAAETVFTKVWQTAWVMEAYRTVHFPTDVGSCCQASIYVNIDTGTDGNDIPWYIFHRLFPGCKGSNSQATRSLHTNIYPSTYIGGNIPKLSVLHLTATLKSPKHHWHETLWLVINSPDPIILSLPLYIQLKVVKHNCAM